METVISSSTLCRNDLPDTGTDICGSGSERQI